jgi:hypothetical protein
MGFDKVIFDDVMKSPYFYVFIFFNLYVKIYYLDKKSDKLSIYEKTFWPKLQFKKYP